MSEAEDKIVPMPCAEITEKGITLTSHNFSFMEMVKTKKGEELMEVKKLFEYFWLNIEGGRSYVSFIGPHSFTASYFHKNDKICRQKAEELRNFLLTQIKIPVAV